MKITQELLDAYYKGTCSEQEAKLIEDWMAQGTPIAEMPDPPHIAYQKKKAWSKLDPQRKQHALFGWKIAASIFLCMAAGLFTYRQFYRSDTDPLKTVSTTKGQRLRLTLPDSSIVYLNAASSITYPQKFNGKTREVSFHGEVFFDVRHLAGQPFIVRGPKSLTHVLGTSFNLEEQPGKEASSIVVATGKVLFRPSAAQKDVEVHPDEQYTFTSNQGLKRNKVSAQHYSAWTHDELIFNNTELKEVVSKLENWYGVKICIMEADLEHERYTGRFKDAKLGEVLRLIGFALQFHYKQHEQCIQLTRMRKT